MGLFEKLYPNATDAERAEWEVLRAEQRKHLQQRACPRRCGCTEFYDDRESEVVTGGFGVAGCQCPRCNDDEPSHIERGE